MSRFDVLTLGRVGVDTLDGRESVFNGPTDVLYLGAGPVAPVVGGSGRPARSGARVAAGG